MIAAGGVETIYDAGVVQVRALCGVDLMVSAGEVGSRALVTPCSQ
jgi:hypothetical protein